MDYSKVFIILVCALCLVFSIECEILRDVASKQGTLIRQKKRIVTMKKPLQHHDRVVRGRQTDFHRTAHPPSATDEFSIAFSSTSENPNGHWRPIPYVLYTDRPQVATRIFSPYRAEDVNTVANGVIGHIERNMRKNAIEKDHSQSSGITPHHEQVTEQYEDYASLHYYIPFEQLLAKIRTPIMEIVNEHPPSPINVDKLVKAAIEPVAIFPTESTTASTPDSGTSAEHNTVFKTEDSNSNGKDEPTAARYEYEYFVQDSKHGTNFGHKEIRDGKQTRGDYEVVLPDGRVQHVRYWSDATGYHATVTYHPLYEKFHHSKL